MMPFAAPAAPVLAIPPPTPTQAYGTQCPPMAAPWPAPSALSASGGSGSSTAEYAFPSPPLPATLLSVQCVTCLPIRLARTRRG